MLRQFSVDVKEDPRDERNMKFSAFAKKQRDYTPEDRVQAMINASSQERFQPKEEFTRLKFDPNVRHRLPEMDNTIVYRAMQGFEPDYEPQSNYVAIKRNGKTWHLFNGARFPLGRMAQMIAVYIRGKHTPLYDPKYSGEFGDNCVVVNAANQFTTGNKRQWKMYRKYTGYVGNMKETVMRE
jgi:hypothetical protein